MYKIINRHVYEIASGENITLCDIIADSASDLPGADDIAIYKIAFGSFAYVIDEGVFYSLDSSGTWNGGAYSDVVTEVVTARGSFSSLDDRLDDMDVILNSAKLGVKYKGAVNYYNDLPATGNEIGDAYTVKYAGSSGTTPDGTEYVWGELGGVAQWIDFSKDCYTKSEINTMLAGKVDVEAGKGLSSNDFTDADKSKLDGIAAGAEVNVQSDWEQTDNTSDDFIKNKPTLGTAAAAAATDFATAAQGTKADSAIQSAGSGLSKNGTTINHSNSITAKTTRTIRKLSFDAQGHINGSGELSAAESDAIASGVDSTKVAQIETNKNNILTDEAALVELVDGGAKNDFDISSTAANYNATTTIDLTTGKVSVTSAGAWARSAIPISLPAGNYIFSTAITLPSGGCRIQFNTAADGSGTGIGTPALNPTESGEYSAAITLSENKSFYVMLYNNPSESGDTRTVAYDKLMLCTKAAWDISPSYQPYRPSYQELYDRILALENNP